MPYASHVFIKYLLHIENKGIDKMKDFFFNFFFLTTLNSNSAFNSLASYPTRLFQVTSEYFSLKHTNVCIVNIINIIKNKGTDKIKVD